MRTVSNTQVDGFSRTVKTRRSVMAARSSHLTRRGRWVAALTLVLVAGFGGLAISTAQASGSQPGIHVGYVVVEPGDSLWSIAAAQNRVDVRSTVRAIRQLNNLDGMTLWPGQRLLLPLDQSNRDMQ